MTSSARRDPDAFLEKEAPDGRLITVDTHYTFGKVRIHISSTPGYTYDDAW